MRDAVVHLLARQPRSRAKAGDPSDVLGAAPEPPLLPSAVDDGFERDALTHVEGADALRTVKLMPRESQRRDWRLRDVDRYPAGGLDGVGVERYILRRADLGELGQRLDGANLVVRPYDRGKRGVGTQRGGKLGRVDEPVGVHPDPGHLETLEFQASRGLPHRRVLDARDDRVPLFGANGSRQTEDRQVI